MESNLHQLIRKFIVVKISFSEKKQQKNNKKQQQQQQQKTGCNDLEG